METRRWTNPSQPQTLQIAVLLFYFRAVMMALFGAIFVPLGVVLIAACVGSGFGIANERRWGYALALITAAVTVLLRVDGGLIGLIFAVALVALLLHPQSRDYQRIWFS